MDESRLRAAAMVGTDPIVLPIPPLEQARVVPLIFRVVNGATQHIQGAAIDMGSLVRLQSPV